jgi:pentafunctional AROM polypeptide
LEEETGVVGDSGAGSRASAPSANLPIIYTVRSRGEGGRFEGSVAEYARLCLLGAKGGADIVDVELGRSSFPPAELLQLVASIEAAGAAVLPSAHWPAAPPPSSSVLAAAVAASLRYAPRAVAVKTVASAAHPGEGAAFLTAAQSALAQLSSASAPPLLAVAMGAPGQLTRVCNDVLTPVTHGLLSVAAAPGQLSLASVRSLRASLGIVRPRAYYLFGRPVRASLSPALHNTGFSELSLPHAYGLIDTDSASYAVAVLRGSVEPVITPTLIVADSRPLPPFVGGGNITIPLKTDVLRLLDKLSPAAQAIGAVNVVTCVPLSDGGVRLCGDNTDWLGIYWPVSQRLSVRRSSMITAAGYTSGSNGGAVLILGAGGTAMAAAYAAERLGLVPLFHNRTHSKAEALALRFHGAAVASLERQSDISDALAMFSSSGGSPSIVAVLSTLPPTAEFVLPDWVFAHRPVVLDAAYASATTPLLRSAAASGCETIAGAEMLCAQGLAAFGIWIGRTACCSTGSCAGRPPALPASVPADAMVRAVAASLRARSSS